jgi:hypothetical protein
LIWKIIITISILGILGLLAVMTFGLYERPIYTTNVTTVYIVNNTIINITSVLNTTEDKPKITLPSFGEGAGARVVS